MARIVAGADVHPLIDRSLAPVLRAIGASLGPHGRSVLYDRGGTVARAATGFAIAREMPMPEGPAGVAPRLLKEGLFAADRDWSDGTARLALIAGGCFAAAAREARSGVPVRALGDAIAAVARTIASHLDAERLAQADLPALARTAGLAPDLADRLAALVNELGGEAVFDVKENNGRGLDMTRAQGFVFAARPLGEAALSDLAGVHVLVCDDIIQDFGALAPVLEGFAGKRKALVIAARDITGAALATLKRNQQAAIVTVAALQPQDAGQRAADGLEDLAVATGATLIAERFGTRIERLRPAMLGKAGSFRFADGLATFLKPCGAEKDVRMRRRLLRAAAVKARHLSYDREQFERRAARLGGQWCELRLAGDTGFETELLLRTARAALAAMQSAVRHGALAGGGDLYARLAARLAAAGASAPQRAAARAVGQGLLAIPRHLAVNGGASAGFQPASGSLPQDPLFLTKDIINQGLGLAASLLSAGTLVAR